jgi:hypothetical protein
LLAGLSLRMSSAVTESRVAASASSRHGLYCVDKISENPRSRGKMAPLGNVLISDANETCNIGLVLERQSFLL